MRVGIMGQEQQLCQVLPLREGWGVGWGQGLDTRLWGTWCSQVKPW